MAYLVILPLIAGVIFALVIFLRRSTRPTSKRGFQKVAVIFGGFLLIAVLASIHLVLNAMLFS